MAEVTVYDNKRRAVGAKILRDANGSPILEPITGFPLIVDEDFDVDRAIAFGHALANLPVDRSSAVPHWEKMGSIYTLLFNAFEDGGPLEMQRSYNKKVGGAEREFVNAFQPAASYIYGLVARAAGLSPQEIIGAAGVYNWSRKYIRGGRNNTSGPMFNAPRNVPWMDQGMRAYDSGVFSQPSSKKQEGSANQFSINSDETINPNPLGNSVSPEQESAEQGEPQNPANFGKADLPAPTPQFARAEQAGRSARPVSAAALGVPQHVIDAGNLLRANGYEITPRTMYLAHVLGPQAAVDLMKRTGSTASPAVPSPDTPTGDQMRAWVRALRLGPAAAGIAGGMTQAPNAEAAAPDQLNPGAFDPTQPVA